MNYRINKPFASFRINVEPRKFKKNYISTQTGTRIVIVEKSLLNKYIYVLRVLRKFRNMLSIIFIVYISL